jgi:regulatory protein
MTRESDGGFGRGRRGFGRGRRKPPAEPESPEAARAKAIGLLARRDFGARELKGRLADAGYDRTAADAAVTDLQEERLVDDARYVESAVAGRVARGQGPVRIALELKRVGIAAALVDEAVDAKSPEWSQRATELRRRRFGREIPKDPKERTRQVRFLLYRGFSMDHVRAALGRAALEELQGEDFDGGDFDPSADEPD